MMHFHNHACQKIFSKSSNCSECMIFFDAVSLQRSPQASLDIGLIGIYPCIGSRYVMATNENVILVTRVPREALQRSKRFGYVILIIIKFCELLL